MAEHALDPLSSTPRVRISLGAGKGAHGIAGILADEAGDATFPTDGASGLQFAASTIGDMASVYDLLFTLEAITTAGAGFRWTCPGKVESSPEVKGELDDEAATVHEGI